MLFVLRLLEREEITVEGQTLNCTPAAKIVSYQRG